MGLAAAIAVLHLLQRSVAVRHVLTLVRHSLLARLVELLHLFRTSLRLMRQHSRDHVCLERYLRQFDIFALAIAIFQIEI